jgi:hypothetical protein
MRNDKHEEGQKQDKQFDWDRFTNIAFEILILYFLFLGVALFVVLGILSLKFNSDTDSFNYYYKIFRKILVVAVLILGIALGVILFLSKNGKKSAGKNNLQKSSLSHNNEQDGHNDKKTEKPKKGNQSKPFDWENFKVLLLKILLVLTAIAGGVGIIGAIVVNIKFSQNESLQNYYTGYALIFGFGVGCLLMMIIVIIMFSFKDKPLTSNGKRSDYKIISYKCTVTESIFNQCKLLYDNVIPLSNDNDFYAYYRKANETIVIAYMKVDTTFSEEQFIAFMDKIPQLTEKVLAHTLIAVFEEKEKSNYLTEIMNCPEYYGLYDTKVYCVYNPQSNRLKVNKTNSGVGNKPFRDAKKELDKIFCFERDEK